MTTSPDLVKAISGATGLALATVTDLDRRLAKGNLRPVGGRGPNAAKMGTLEAARLLTAVLACPQSNEAAETVLRYAKTRPDKVKSSDGLFGAIGLDDLAALSPKHSFVEGLAELISSTATGSLAALKLSSRKQSLSIEVCAFTRATRGRIRISGLPNGSIANVEYVASAAERAPTRKGRSVMNAKVRTDAVGDLEQSRRITKQTILSVATLFA